MRVGKRDVGHVALDLEFHVAGMARNDGFTHIVAGGLGQHQRQIAMHACAVDPVQAAGQVDHAQFMCVGCFAAAAGYRGRALPVQAGLAFPVGIGKAQIAQLQFKASLDWQRLRLRGGIKAFGSCGRREVLPRCVGGQPLEGHSGFVEYAGEIECAARNGDAGLAAALRQVEVDGGGFNARAARAGQRGRGQGRSGRGLACGRRRCRQLGAGQRPAWRAGQPQSADPSRRRIADRRSERAGPARLQCFDQPSRCQRFDQRLATYRQRQSAGDVPDGGQIELVGGEAGLFRRSCAGIAVRDCQVAARPDQAVGKLEFQVFSGRIKTARAPRTLEPRRHVCKSQRLKAGADLQRQAFKGHVNLTSHHAATRHVKPRAQRTPAAVEAPARLVWQLARRSLQRRNIGQGHGQLGPIRFGIELPRPLIDVAAAQRQKRPTEVAA